VVSGSLDGGLRGFLGSRTGLGCSSWRDFNVSVMLIETRSIFKRCLKKRRVLYERDKRAS